MHTLEALLVDTWTHLGVLLKEIPDRKQGAERALMQAVKLGTSRAATAKDSSSDIGSSCISGVSGRVTAAAKGGAAGQVL